MLLAYFVRVVALALAFVLLSGFAWLQNRGDQLAIERWANAMPVEKPPVKSLLSASCRESHIQNNFV